MGLFLLLFVYSFFKIYFYLFFKDFIFLFDRERAQAGWVQAEGEGEAASPAEQGARCGAWSQDPEIMTWAKVRLLTDWATQAPQVSTIF